MDILQIINLHKSYNATVALQSININIPQQGIFGLLGPNGAGKSTLIRIINQIIEQDNGSILFDGELLQPKHIAQIGYLPEERGLYKKMNVWDQLLFFARLKGMTHFDAKKCVNDWLQKFEIEHWKNKSIDELSKGMAQKIQFIATVIHKPKLLILDEPFSGFDPMNAELIKNEILELRARGMTIILSTHRMESVERLCDSIALLHHSKVLLQGPLNAIKDTFAGEKYLVKLKANTNNFPTENIKSNRGDMYELEVGLDGKNRNELLQELMHYGEIMEFSKLIPSMEQIFIHQIKQINHG